MEREKLMALDVSTGRRAFTGRRAVLALQQATVTADLVADRARSEPPSRRKRWGQRIGAGLVVLALLGVGAIVALHWVAVAPVEYDVQWMAEQSRRFRSHVPADSNGYLDYRAIDSLGVITLSNAYPQHADPLGDLLAQLDRAAHVAEIDLAPAKAALRHNALPVAVWDTARRRPFSRGHIDFHHPLRAPQRPVKIEALAHVRLVATIDDPHWFADAVAATAHAIRTLSDHAGAIDAAAGCRLVEALSRCVASHLRLLGAELGVEGLATLDDILADLIARLSPIEIVIAGDLMQGIFALENKAVWESDDTVAAQYWRALASRQARAIEPTIRQLLHEAQWPNAQLGEPNWTPQTLFDASVTPLERLRIETLKSPTWPPFANLREAGRSRITKLRQLRLALRLETYWHQHGDWPETLSAVALGPWDVGPLEYVDDWAPEKPFHYEIRRDPDGSAGYSLGSVGPDGRFSTIYGEKPELIFTMRPRHPIPTRHSPPPVH